MARDGRNCRERFRSGWEGLPPGVARQGLSARAGQACEDLSVRGLSVRTGQACDAGREEEVSGGKSAGAGTGREEQPWEVGGGWAGMGKHVGGDWAGPARGGQAWQVVTGRTGRG